MCEQARCPNIGECWNAGTATMMMLGEVCTRACRFCATKTGNPRGFLEPEEPERIAQAVLALGLRYVVLTMVDRDDLPDGGASHLASAIRNMRDRIPGLGIEALIGDFGGRTQDLELVIQAGPDVLAHNLEVVSRLTPTVRDPRCGYQQSLQLLAHAKRTAGVRYVKSSLMLGMGETDAEVGEALADLRSVGVDIVTLGQYLSPTSAHLPVHRFLTPEEFSNLARLAGGLGFAFVAAGPLVRSSYHAAEAFVSARPEQAPRQVEGGSGPT